MNQSLWWESEAWNGRLVDFLVAVDSMEGKAVAEKFISHTVKQNVRYEGRAVKIPSDFLMEAYKVLGTPANGIAGMPRRSDSPVAQAERNSFNSCFELWSVYTKSFGIGGFAEDRARALLSSAEWTDEEVCRIVQTLVEVFHARVPAEKREDLTPQKLRALIRELFAGPDAGSSVPWNHLLYNPNLTRLITEEGDGYYDNFLAGVLDATEASEQAYAFKALIAASWNPNPHMGFISNAYHACDDPFRRSGSNVTWARTAVKDTLSQRRVAHYVIEKGSLKGLLKGEGPLTLSQFSAALLLRPDNEEACKKAVSSLLKKQDWNKLAYFTPALGAGLADLAVKFGDSDGNVPIEWLLEVSS